MRLRTKIWHSPLYPVEWATLAGGLLCFVLYAWFGIGSRGFLVFYGNTLKTAAYLYPLGLLVCHLAITVELGLKWRRSGSHGSPPNIWKEFRTRFLTSRIIFRDLRHLHALALCLIIAIHLKHLIPFVNPHMLDPLFLQGEKNFLSGRIGLELLLQIIPLSWTPGLSVGYQGYYPYLSALVFIIVLQRDFALTREFSIAFVFLWYVGMLVVYAVPTLGPCFFAPKYYSLLPETKMTLLQQDLLSMKHSLEVNPHHPSALYSIAGFPSLHLAVALLGTWYLFQVHKVLGALSFLFSVITIVTTVYFGWHYIADDLGALALVAIAIVVAKKTRRLGDT